MCIFHLLIKDYEVQRLSDSIFVRDCSLVIKWLSNYIYLLEMFVRQIVNFFPPNENATPARVRCSRDRQARKKMKKVAIKMPS